MKLAPVGPRPMALLNGCGRGQGPNDTATGDTLFSAGRHASVGAGVGEGVCVAVGAVGSGVQVAVGEGVCVGVTEGRDVGDGVVVVVVVAVGLGDSVAVIEGVTVIVETACVGA